MAEADADRITGELTAQLAAWSSLATELDTPFAQFKQDEAQARLDTWTALETSYVAQYDPAGVDTYGSAALTAAASQTAAWETYALAAANIQHQETLDRLAASSTLELAQAAAEHQQTTRLADIQQAYQQVKYGLAEYSSADYDYAGLTVETYEDEYGEPYTYAPHRDTVYRESVKQAWREEDQAQREARLNYVTTLGSAHQTSEAAQAAAVLTYQQARAAASRIEQDARAALRVDFNKLQASTFATETAGWLTSAPTPWHKQLASQAEAEATYRAVEQDASLLQQQAEHAAKENYLDDRETARVTLRTDRAAASAAEAFTEQQNLENGHEYGDEYYDDHDPYQNVTVDLPTGLNYDNASDPDGVSHTLDDDPFSGQFSLGGAFGSQIGGGAYSPDDPEGSYYGEYSNYGLADQQASQVRGGTFDTNNPLGALGRSDAQVNGTQTVNWGNSPRNQQTNQQPPTQIAGLDAAEAPEWTSNVQFDFAHAKGTSSNPVGTDATPPRMANNELPAQANTPDTVPPPELPSIPGNNDQAQSNLQGVHNRPKTHLPATHRGSWSGDVGDSTFTYSDTPENRSKGVAGHWARFKDGYIAVGAFSDEFYWKGNKPDATVNIPEVNGDRSDYTAADNAMREKLRRNGDPNWRQWKRPDGYTWHHAGSPGSTTMELVDSEFHSSIAHEGSASGTHGRKQGGSKPSTVRSRYGLASRSIAVLDVYMNIRDALKMTGALPPDYEVTGTFDYFFVDGDGNVFTVSPPGWFSQGKKNYIAGPKSGTSETILKESVNYYRSEAEKAWGKYIPGNLWREPTFIEGTIRKTLPIYDDLGQEIGYVDKDGPHYYTFNINLLH